MKRFKKLTPDQMLAVANEIKMMVSSHRDRLWTWYTECAFPQAVDPQSVQLIVNDGHYGEAFGVIRGLAALGYGYLGPVNLNAVDQERSEIPEHNLRWWFDKLVGECLMEEGFYDKSCTPAKARAMLEKYERLVRE